MDATRGLYEEALRAHDRWRFDCRHMRGAGSQDARNGALRRYCEAVARYAAATGRDEDEVFSTIEEEDW